MMGWHPLEKKKNGISGELNANQLFVSGFKFPSCN
jgi:hypothetical protein